MPTETILSLVGLALTIGTAIIVITVYICGRITALETKIQPIWDHIINAALSEALNKNLLKMNSPLIPTDKTYELFGMAHQLKKDLQKFYKEEGYKLSDDELFFAIQERFGSKIRDEISVFWTQHYPACVMAAVQIAKENHEVS